MDAGDMRFSPLQLKNDQVSGTLCHEGAALARCTLNIDAVAVALNDVLDNRQPQIGDTQVLTNPRHQLTEDYITDRLG